MLSSKRNSGTTGIGDDPEGAGANVAKRKRQKPMYQVLKADLEHAIRSGKLKPGELVPSESELIAKYQVSSTTARRSLDELEADGLLERKRGKGTFVSALAKMLNRPRIAVVVKDFLSLAHPFLATVVGTIEHTLEKEGLHVVIVRARVGGEEEQTLSRLPEMLEHEGARHVFLLSNLPLNTVEPLLDQGFHCLGVNTRYMDSRIPYVAIDFDDAFSISLRELLQRGHRTICNIIQEVPMAKIGVMNSSSILESAYTKLKEEFPHLPEKPLVHHVDG